jgi:hypothetical protein
LRAIIDEKSPAPSFQAEPVLTENSYCFNIGKEDENNAKPFESEEYQNCLKVNGDKTYYLGVIDGCRDRANTQKNCELWDGLSTAPHPVIRDYASQVSEAITTPSTSLNKTESPFALQIAPRSIINQDCKTWSDSLDIRQAAINRTREVIDRNIMWNAVQSIPHGEHNELVTSDLWNTKSPFNICFYFSFL